MRPRLLPVLLPKASFFPPVVRWHGLCSSALPLSLMPWIDIKDPTPYTRMMKPSALPHWVPSLGLHPLCPQGCFCLSFVVQQPPTVHCKHRLFNVCLFILVCLNLWRTTFTPRHSDGATTGTLFWSYSNQLDYMIYSRCLFDSRPAVLVSSLQMVLF